MQEDTLELSLAGSGEHGSNLPLHAAGRFPQCWVVRAVGVSAGSLKPIPDSYRSCREEGMTSSVCDSILRLE